MTIQHVNRLGRTYYLYQATTDKGATRYFFSRSTDAAGTPVEAVPDGYEIYEHPRGQVYLRRAHKIEIDDHEISLVEKGVRRHTRLKHFLVDRQAKAIVIHTPGETADRLQAALSQFAIGLGAGSVPDLEPYLSYLPMMRFTLVDKERRLFQPARYCLRGRIDGWIDIGSPDRLDRLVATYVRHLDKDSFYDLF